MPTIKRRSTSWNDRLELDYGLNKTKSDGTKKTNDKIYLSSTYGYEIAKNWYASGLMTFQTQFAKGYDYNVDPDVFISRFMSPGYLLIGAGFTWTPKSWFTATFTPATWRGTFVSSKILSDQGDFGVTPGKHLFSEFGANLRMEAKYEFLKNMTVFSRLNLYSNYLKDPQNVDISWDVQLNMAINQWFSCNITTNMYSTILTPKSYKKTELKAPVCNSKKPGRRFSGYLLKSSFQDKRSVPESGTLGRTFCPNRLLPETPPPKVKIRRSL